MGKGWIGVDLDGTLAQYDGWKGVDHIGLPVPKMLDRVKAWLAEGADVRIFTARTCREDEADMIWAVCEASGTEPDPDELHILQEAARVRKVIGLWCKQHVGQVLPITHKKNFSMMQLWDDRAIQVVENTGVRADGKV